MLLFLLELIKEKCVECENYIILIAFNVRMWGWSWIFKFDSVIGVQKLLRTKLIRSVLNSDSLKLHVVKSNCSLISGPWKKPRYIKIIKIPYFNVSCVYFWLKIDILFLKLTLDFKNPFIILKHDM